ncbi:MAG: ABC transporter substrate-binding protein [Acidimicrobiia bacterium]
MRRWRAGGFRSGTHRAAVVAVLLATACGASPRVERLVAARQAEAARASASQGVGPADDGYGSGSSASDLQALADAAVGTGTRDATPAAGSGRAGGTTATTIGRTTGTVAGPASGEPGVTAGPADPAAETTAAPVEGNGGATDTGVTATSIKIGATFFNGNYLDKYSQVTEQAAAAYFRYVNDQGGIYGRKIEYLTCDTAGTADGTQGCLRKLANNDKVFAMGPGIDFNLDTVQPFLAEQRLPWIGDPGFYQGEFDSPWMFPTQIAAFDVGALIGKFSKQKLGVATVGVSYLNDVAGPPCTERVRQIGEQMGYQVVATAENNQTQGDLTQQVLTIQAANPDAVLFCNDPINTIKFIQAAGRINYRPPKGWVGGFVAADDIPLSAGSAGVGMYGFTSYDFYGSDLPGVRQFRQITEHYYPSIFHHFYSQAAYVGAMALVEGLRKAGPKLTRSGLVAAMRSFTDFDTTMGLRINFADLNSGTASGIMLQADDKLRWKVVAERFGL